MRYGTEAFALGGTTTERHLTVIWHRSLLALRFTEREHVIFTQRAHTALIAGVDPVPGPGPLASSFCSLRRSPGSRLSACRPKCSRRLRLARLTPNVRHPRGCDEWTYRLRTWMADAWAPLLHLDLAAPTICRFQTNATKRSDSSYPTPTE